MKVNAVFLWILGCCLLPTLLMAQVTYTLNGRVSDANNYGLANYPVYVRLLGFSGSPQTIYTNQGGYYSHSVTWTSPNNAYIEVSAQTCTSITGAPNIDTVIFTPNQLTVTRNFQVGCQGTCNAGFQYQPAGNGVFRMIGFANTADSADQVISWRWTYAGTIIDTTQNPLLQLGNSSGVVCLQIGTQWGCSAMFCDTVRGGSQCNATFSYTSTQPNTLHALGSAQTAPNDPVASWFWSIDSIAAGTTQNLNLTNLPAGSHVVSLTITTITGCSSTTTTTVVVSGGSSNSCSVQISGNATTNAHLWVFQANPQTAAGDSIISIRWQLNNSPSFVTYQGNPITMQLQSGWNRVCVVMTTASNCTASACDSFYVQPNNVNCSVSYTYTVQNASTGNTILFTPNFSGINSSTVVPSYIWTFGNGQTSTASNPIMTFMPGVYHVCVEAFISGTSCRAVYCDTLVINANPATCQVAISANAVPNTGTNTYTVNATATGSSTPGTGVQYTWRIGSRYLSGGSSISVPNVPPGTYPICVTAYFSNNCIASACDTIVVGTTSACSVSFTVVPNPTASSTYRLVAHSSRPNAQYAWTINNNIVTNPNLVTIAPGTTVQICVTASFSGGCAAVTSCGSFTAPVNTNSSHTISGIVVAQNTLLSSTSARVWLIKLGVINGVWTLTAMDSTLTDSAGRYTFNNVLSGDYFVKAALMPGTPYYADFIPTYYGQSLYWVQATNIVVPGANQNRHIYMIRGNNPGGSGFIGGSVAQGANKTQNLGDPMPNILVILLDGNNNAVDYTYTDANGNFGFYSLDPTKQYRVTTDVENRADENNPMVYPNVANQTVIITVDTRVVSFTVQTTTALSENITTRFSAFPNPVSDKLTLKFSEQTNEEIQLTWLNVMGQVVKNETITTTNNAPVQVNLTDMPQGVYLLKLTTKTGNNLGAIKMIKQ